MNDLNFFQQLFLYYQQNFSYVFSLFVRHFLIAFYGVLFACIVAIPLGIFLSRKRKLMKYFLAMGNLMQTIPSLALVSIIMFVIGLGANTVIIAIFIYSLLPIFKNTYTGIVQVNPTIIDAGKGMGMTGFQRLRMIEIPLAMPMIVSGIRNAFIVGIGIAAIGSFIGAGGLGDIIIRGTNVTNGASIIVAGALPTALMAVIADFLIGKVQTVFERKVS